MSAGTQAEIVFIFSCILCIEYLNADNLWPEYLDTLALGRQFSGLGRPLHGSVRQSVIHITNILNMSDLINMTATCINF